jgi:hypothetical protein
LQAALDKKDALVPGYRGACDQLWLLVVADNSTLARGVDLEGFESEHQFTSSFDRVFFFAHMRWVKELKIAPPGAG